MSRSRLTTVATLGGFVAGEDFCQHGVDAEPLGDPIGGGLVVAGEHDDLDAQIVERGYGGLRGFPRCVGDPEDTRRVAVYRGENGGPAVGRQFVALLGDRTQIDALTFHEPPVAHHNAPSGDQGGGSVTGHVLEVLS